MAERGRLRWVPAGHRIVDPDDPDMRTIAAVGYALGIRFHFRLRPAWLGPWRLVDGRWQRQSGPPDNPITRFLLATEREANDSRDIEAPGQSGRHNAGGAS